MYTLECILNLYYYCKLGLFVNFNEFNVDLVHTDLLILLFIGIKLSCNRNRSSDILVILIPRQHFD